MSARETILARIRAAAAASGLPEAGGDAAERAARVSGRLAGGEQSAPTPQIARLEGRARIDRFRERLQALSATSSVLRRRTDLPKALAEQLQARAAPPALRLGDEPDFAGLDWAGAGLEASRGPGRREEPAALSRAIAGLAETGQLAFLSGPDNPATLTFLAETHFALLRSKEIEAGYEGLWARLRALGADPRTVTLVAGPSRTADIAATIELGAHGPVALHVFLIDDA